MKHGGTHDHGHAGAHGQRYFSDSEWAALQADDVKAGKAVVGLMLAIFTIGLFLYLGVCLAIIY